MPEFSGRAPAEEIPLLTKGGTAFPQRMLLLFLNLVIICGLTFPPINESPGTSSDGEYMIGKTISQYQIVEKLGQGGMGVVYRAEDTKLNRSVAIKMLPFELGADEDQKTRFLQEARAASAMDHPNIGAIYEIDETPEGDLFIAMAYYEGETLKQLIQKGPLPLETAIDIGKQIAQGMRRAHSAGVIHRDLKPANILITSDGIVKIIDFGLAKFAWSAQLTRSGTSVGTVAYMSPEQLRGEEVDARSDIWAFGVILFEMLAGKHPFRGEFETALMYSIANESPTSLSQYRDDVPAGLSHIISNCLEKDPGKRVQRMEEIVALFSPAHSATSATAFQSLSETKEGISPVKRIDKKKLTLIGSACVLLIAVMLGYLHEKHTIGDSGSSVESHSLAILPLINRGEPEQQYYADGLTDDIRQELSRLPHVLVISSVSSSLYAGPDVNVKSAAAALGAKYIIHGELQLLRASLKLHLSLYDADRDQDIWDNRYDALRKDILTTKAGIINEVCSKLGFTPSTKVPSRSINPDVYELYLQGIFYAAQAKKEGALLAHEYFSEVVQRDSTYIPALLDLATTKFASYVQGWDKSEEMINGAEALCRKAQALDPTNAQAEAILGAIACEHGHVKEGLSILRHAIDRDNNNAFALTEAAFTYMYRLGEPGKAVPLLKKLEELDPENSLYLSNLGVAYAQMLRDYPEAIKTFKQAMHLNPSDPRPIVNIAYAFERMGRYDSAVFYYTASLQKDPTSAQAYESLASVLFVTGKIATADSILGNAIRILPDNQQILYVYGVANILQGRRDAARKVFENGARVSKLKIRQNPSVSVNFANLGLFEAKLGNAADALASLQKAIAVDSTNDDVLIKAARTYAILERKKGMIDFFRKAKAVNPEYDIPYLSTALDFEKYRADPDLLIVAQSE